ncbi:chlorophyll(ide) b reductase NOL, chloroplastic isoform X4 [Alnus glutinosa]|uniref:chlorophyll(ide) b reductase NOL, chloroplastic isoform X4 n=1 Tax=Alnus glutinosa TaxID=3517 RepID=UPI002D78DDDF|nr:chlorophyll(ide) b reductase NOL, chloroplastic isoform X4 [Alnus glutinosa]
MAITPSLHSTSPSLSPLLSPKTHHSFLFPFSQPHLPIRKFDRYTFLTVGPRHNLHLSLRPCAVNLNSQTIKAEASVNREPMVPPYNVLITGSTKAERVESAVRSLREEFGEQHVWINNAGSNAYSYKPLAETSDEDLIEVVTTNTLGLMICCREAIKMMLNQPRGGHIFNIDGAGSDGRPTPRFAAYGATKRSVVHLTKSLQAELQMQDVKNVLVHNLSPGMVTTDLLMSGANTKQAKFFINILAEPAEVVAEYLVPNIRSVPASGSTKPTYIRFLTGIKAYWQIFSRFAFSARRNRYLLED